MDFETLQRLPIRRVNLRNLSNKLPILFSISILLQTNILQCFILQFFNVSDENFLIHSSFDSFLSKNISWWWSLLISWWWSLLISWWWSLLISWWWSLLICESKYNFLFFLRRIKVGTDFLLIGSFLNFLHIQRRI